MLESNKIPESIKQEQRLYRLKEQYECLSCEVVVFKEFRQAPISICKGNGGPIEMAQMIKVIRDVADRLEQEFPETKEIMPMLKNPNLRTAYKEVTNKYEL